MNILHKEAIGHKCVVIKQNESEVGNSMLQVSEELFH